ncbi:MAG: acyltransferase domain-containing protein, partial [Candidatus Eremiobacteraeota bacterium]|nr:acyltransferase domain-containing protein [Candidatus Eremiobacteraeota bacterium]
MSTALHTPLAVIGAACLLPGADGLDAYWSLLRDGREAIGEFPADRLDRSLYYCPEPGRRGRTYTGRAGLVPKRQPDSGDQNWDLCHRLFCDVAREAVEHARLDPARLAALQAGVYVGHSAGSSANGDLTLATLAGHAFTPLLKMEGLDQASLFDKAVARLRQGRPRRHGPDQPAFETQRVSELVARALGLQGPQVVVDAACASGLVALALAGLDLASGSVEVALVGGASFAKVESLVLFSQAQSCSRSGQSRPFDESADGLVAAEGYVCLVVKTEARARHDGDRILGVVRGIGLSSDGRGRSLWAPQKEGQMAALRRAYADRLDPGRVQYLEAHATSTQVGDATELESLGEFFKPYTQAPIPLGSVKSNLGHTLETAGLAGLLKVLLALEQGQLPPSLGVEQLNRSVDWSSLPLEVVTSGLPWPRPEQGPRCAGVSAFGIGGLNVHVVVEEAGPRPLPGAPTPALEPVALVGRGVVLPGAHDLEGMRSGGHGPGPAPLERWPGHLGLANQNGHRAPSTPTVHGAFIRDYEYDYLAHKIPPKQVSRANPLQFQLLDATQQALAEAGAIEPGETAVVVGTTFGGDFNNELLLGLRFPEIQQCLRAILLEDGLAQTRVEAMLADFEREFFTLYPALLDETGGFTSSTLASRITKTFDLEGGAMAVEAGDCSSAVGLAAACALLRGGLCQAVICAGAARSLNLLTYETLNLRGFFEEPGYFPGEGVAVVVLMTLSEARRQGKRVLGLLHGTGSHFDPDQPGRALLAAGARALEGSRVKADRIRRLRLGQAPLELPGPELDHLYPQLEDQLKGLSGFGHLGAAEAVVNLVESSMSPHGFEAVGQTSPQGLATQIVTSPAPPVTRPCSHLRLGGASLEEVMARLVDETDGGQQAFQAHHRVRLAILSPDPNRMADKRRLAASLIGDPQARPRLEEQGIFLGTLTAPLARVAFVFAGQGSQYPGMMRDVVEASPAAAALLTRADSALHSHGLGSFASLAWEDDEALDADPVTTQVAVLVADCLIYEAIREAGLEPDCVAGHSFGEIPAMVAARVITLEEAIALTIERARALRQASPDGGLISIQATPQQLLPLLEQAPGELFITHRNAPSQTVVGGKLEHLERLAASLKDKSLAYRRLPVPGALHTPLVASAQPALARVLEGLQLRPPTRLFYSNVTNDRVHDPSGFAQNLVAQLVEPVAYAELLERMRADGVGVFLEVGPGQILTGLHRQVLAQDQVVLTAADHRRRSYGEQLERVKAALECVGLSSWSTSPNLPRPVGGPIEEFDATAARRSRQHPTPLAADTGESRSELARYLIDFVVEYTGYPAEVIDLDWDLEADLGIDSIRRTQLLGEIGEVFSIQTKGKVDLDSFKTLRQLLAFLQQDTPDQTKSGVDPAYQQAVERGRQIAQPLRQLLRQAALLEDDLEEPGAQPSPSQRLELEGIAHGAGVHPSNLLGYCLRGGQLPQAGVPATAHTHRYVVGTNLLPLPPEAPTRPRLHGGALVVGAGPVARALAAQLSDLTQPVELRAELSPQELERLWPENAFPHLFLVPEDGEDDWQQRRQRVLWGPFALCQAWLRLVKASGLMEEASLVGITSLGGS